MSRSDKVRVIVLSTACGRGHASVAEALKEEADRRGMGRELVVIPVESFADWRYRAGTALYNNTCAYAPWAYRGAYSLTNLEGHRARRASLGSGLDLLRFRRLLRVVRESGPQVIISLFPRGAKILAAIRRFDVSKATLAHVVTDYHLRFRSIWREIDVYFASTFEVVGRLRESGFSGEVILSGIPVRNAFKAEIHGSATSRGEYVLINLGCAGVNSIRGSLADLIEKEGRKELLVLTGERGKLPDSVGGRKNKMIVRTTDPEELADLYRHAAAVVTKPGGVTLSELIAVRQFSLQFFTNHGGQEDANRRYFEARGIGNRRGAIPLPAQTLRIADLEILGARVRGAAEKIIDWALGKA